MSRIDFIEGQPLNSTEDLRLIAGALSHEYLMLHIGSSSLDMGMLAVERMLAVADDTGADMLYADHWKLVEGPDGRYIRKKHPLIECQKGALRDDFDFGSVLLLRSDAFRQAVAAMDVDYRWSALYDLRLRMSRIVHLNEYLYTEMEVDNRKSGEKLFDYVDPRNREVQMEREMVCTAYLKRIGAWLPPVWKEISPLALLGRTDTEAVLGRTDRPEGLCRTDRSEESGLQSTEELPEVRKNDGSVTASVIIPVFNRVRTVRDAVESALSQQCDFSFNVIVVDNHSTDGTTELLASMAAADSRLLHLIPGRDDLGIGGCWNLAVHHEACGEYAVQLDSDDVYSGPETLAKIVAAFGEQKCAMVIGTYQMTDFNMKPIPPGVIDHKEWTEENGRNNALRVNGLGAPRAFRVPLLRTLNLPNTSYGEDYALGLRISREYRIGRIYDVLYFCRRWEGNSDAALEVEKVNANNLYKDRIRTWELEARIRMNLGDEE